MDREGECAEQEGPQMQSHGRQGDAYCKGHELLTWTQWAELGRLGTCVALRPRDVHSEAVLHTGHQE